MNFIIKLKKIKTIDRIDGSWKKEDYINLLELFEYPDPSSIPATDLLEMLRMAITDFEPNEAAEIVLKYKLGDKLNNGQIENLSHEMQQDKVAEDYPEIALHYPLFNINQLLHDSYNGKFPKTQASAIEIELVFKGKIKVTKEVVIRCLSDLLSEKSLLKRLFTDQLDSNEKLSDADDIIWELKPLTENTYTIISSDYWFSREDFHLAEFAGVLTEDEINHTNIDKD